jgi:hypothetical protein
LKAARARQSEAASAPTPLCSGSRVSAAGSPCGFTRRRRPRPIGLDRNASDPPPSLGGVAVGRFTCSCPRLAPPGAGRGRRPRRPRPLAGGQRGGDRWGILVLLSAAFGPSATGGTSAAPAGSLTIRSFGHAKQVNQGKRQRDVACNSKYLHERGPFGLEMRAALT